MLIWYPHPISLTPGHTPGSRTSLPVPRFAIVAGFDVIVPFPVTNKLLQSSYSQKQGNQACELAGAPHEAHQDANYLPPPVDHVEQLILQANRCSAGFLMRIATRHTNTQC